jgi:cytoskeletal protein CcmA (bactofilin family)
MLRMGRSSKTNQAEQEKEKAYQTAPPQPQTYTPQATETAYRPAVEPPQPPRALTESESLARDIKDGTLSGYVGNGTLMTGEATFRGMLRVDGHLTGRVHSEDGTLIVGTGGQVDADVEVAIAVINGTINGDIIASKRLELGRAAHVNGNIQTPALVVEGGAIFEGSCRMIQLKAALEKQQEATLGEGNGKADSVEERSETEDVEETDTPSDFLNVAGAAG